MTIDPICGMTVDEASALRAERDGQTFYFCSDHCRQTVSVNARHREARREADKGKAIYTCPMHPEVQQDHPRRLPQVRHGAGTEDGDSGHG